MTTKFGNCSRCGSVLSPVYFIQEEYRTYDGYTCKTGRVKRACSHLVCDSWCGKEEIVDDSFDGPWYWLNRY